VVSQNYRSSFQATACQNFAPFIQLLKPDIRTCSQEFFLDNAHICQTQMIGFLRCPEQTMAKIKLDKIGNDWEQLFTQFRNKADGSVVCMVNKSTRKRIYIDIRSNRLLSSQEALKYTIDLTSQFLAFPLSAKNQST
jgi:hypothetical protein